MSFVVRFFSFTKRENSTKVPSEATILSGWRADCVLIDDTSFMTPTFKIERTDSSNIINFNYCYVPHFNRYYFITDLRQYHNFWYVSCTCDVLATYKTTIGSGSHYVLRSASSYDGDISDPVYPCDTDITCYIDYSNEGDPMAWSAGHAYILGIVGDADLVAEQFGSLTYYVFNEAALNQFITYLSNNIDQWGQILQTEYSYGVQKALINPIQYIKSAICMPVTDTIGTSVSKVKFGYYEWNIPTGYTVRRINQDQAVSIKETVTINVRQHPQAATRGAYLNCQPYSSYRLHYGPWGDIDLDPMMLKGNSAIKLETMYDLVTGVGRLIVTGYLNTERHLFNGCAQVGVDINLSQIYKDALGYEAATTSGIFGAVAGGASWAGSLRISDSVGNLANALGSISAATQSMERLNYPTVSGFGSTGSFLSMRDPKNLYLTSKFNHIVDENLTEIGRPLNQLVQINTLSGFILCSGADCQITGTQDEAIKVNQYMNTGFFYE